MDSLTVTQILVGVGVGGILTILGGIWHTVATSLHTLRDDLNKHVQVVERFMGSATVELQETKRRVNDVEQHVFARPRTF